MAAGDFSAAGLPAKLVRANAMWMDPRTNRDKYESTEVIRSITENQMVKLDEILVNGSCQGFEVTWLRRCGVTATDCTSTPASPNCELTGNEIEALKKQYQIASCAADTFTVWDDDCKGTFGFEEKVAESMADCVKNLEKKLNLAALTFLDANIHDNTHVVGNVTNVPGDGSYFPTANWTPEIVSQFAHIAILNRIKNPIFTSGSNLWHVQFNAQYNFANDNQKDQLLKLNHFKKWYWDLETVDVTLAEKPTFMFDQGACAFFTKNEFTNKSPMLHEGKTPTWTYCIPSPNLKINNDGKLEQVMYDVYCQPICKTIAQGVMRWGKVFKIMTRYGFAKSPEDCAGNTGIIKFKNGQP